MGPLRPGHGDRTAPVEGANTGTMNRSRSIRRGFAVCGFRPVRCPLREPDPAENEDEGNGVVGGEWLTDEPDGEHRSEDWHQIDEHTGTSRSDQIDASQIEDLR